jgi:glyoxylase-like metal-dependent hydrolase (beta-lactamase superfamily II)
MRRCAVARNSLAVAFAPVVLLACYGGTSASGRAGETTAAGATRDSAPASASANASGSSATTPERWCDRIPRPSNAALERVPSASDWFEVYRVAPGVFALTEPRQFQEAISWLIVGTDTALLFDTGLGVTAIRPVVERLTKLPIEVLNSHTHYDHVGGNHEFTHVLAVDADYTRNNAAGFPHGPLAGEVAAGSFCGDPPAGLDTATFHTSAWHAARTVRDGERLALGGRTLQVLKVPGHTPDAVALLDSANGFLWSGDTYYDGPIWLYVPETDLDRYEQSMARLSALAPTLSRVFPAHNLAVASPASLPKARDAIASIRAHRVAGKSVGDGQMSFDFGTFGFLIAQPLLEGKRAAPVQGGNGLTRWK